MAETKLKQQAVNYNTYSRNMERQGLINGNFDVWQRGASFTNPANAVFTTDHWLVNVVNSGTLPTSLVHSLVASTTADVPQTFNYWRLTTNGAGSGFGVNDYYAPLRQKMEFGTRLLCGAGKYVTVSFWARSSISGKKLAVNFYQDYGTGGSPSSVEVINGQTWTLTSNWTKYTFTTATNTLSGKTLGTNYNDNLSFQFYCMWGANIAPTLGTTGAETFVGSGTIDISQVQVCSGTEALPFEAKNYVHELSECNRYYTKFTNANGGVAAPWGNGYHASTTVGAVLVHFPTPMHLPLSSVETSGVSTIAVTQTGVGRVYGTAVQIIDATPMTAEVQVTVASGLTAGQGTFGTFANGATNYIAFSSEI